MNKVLLFQVKKTKKKKKTGGLLTQRKEWAVQGQQHGPKDVTVQVKTNKLNKYIWVRGGKREVDSTRLHHEGNNFCVRVMLSAMMKWKSVSRSYFFWGWRLRCIGYHISKMLGTWYYASYWENFSRKQFQFHTRKCTITPYKHHAE